uniref:probable carboxylesterase 18 n=1 Tax=Erigeron canadensis TaxID=72917 RepID=UPI001CB938B9|nr:probable carboxylesterase 18 [Erigeron canadensis]
MAKTTKLKTPKLKDAKLDLPCKTRISLGVIGIYIDLCMKKDGTVWRWLANIFPPKNPPTRKPMDGIDTYDIVVDPTTNVWFRVYVPTTELKIEDLPLFIYYHGGGYSLLNTDTKMYDDLCRQICTKLPCIVISPEYGLAPEYKYPSQFDDGVSVLTFLDDPENLKKILLPNLNVSRCFIAGDSAGGNLAHFVTLRATQMQTKFKQLKVIGLLAIQPFFGGEERTNSESELSGKVPFLNLKRTDWFWKAFLPEGEGYDRDHPSVNVSGPRAIDISKVDFPKTMVVVGGFDILKDRQLSYAQYLKNAGTEVEIEEYPNMFHDFITFPELPEADQFISQAKEFVYGLFNKGIKK